MNLIKKMKLSNRANLPSIPAVYWVVSENGQNLYVGSTKNLNVRWKSHHRLKQLKAEGGDCFIHYKHIDISDLESQEKLYIDRLKPLLNWTASSMGSRTVSIREDLHTEIKLAAIRRGMTIAGFIKMMFEDRKVLAASSSASEGKYAPCIT